VLKGLLLCLLLLPAGAAWAGPGDDPARVLILANARLEASVELAEYYADRRGIPRENILALPLPTEETLSGPDFVRSLWNPLLTRLAAEGWLSGRLRENPDPAGRKRFRAYGRNFRYLVLVKGVPLRIADHPEWAADPGPLPEEFRTSRGSVDSELALLAAPESRLAGAIPNPAFGRVDLPLGLVQGVLPISRLDGPSFAAARRLVDSALAGEREGLRGRAYVDLGGPHTAGDEWLEATADLLQGTDYDLSVDRGPGLIAGTDRFDAPALYFGWYSADLAGAWKELDPAVPPGAVAFAIHSFSASTLRSRDRGWVGPLVRRGVAATVGNVYEPYLEGTHRPQLFLRVLLEGGTLGRAALVSNRFLSWQTIVVGDPLYRPFARSLGEQVRALSPGLPFGAYVALSEMNRLAREEGAEAAADWGSAYFRRSPGRVIGLRTARLLRELGRAGEAQRLLQPFTHPSYDPPDQVWLMEAIAGELAALGEPVEAVRLLERLAGVRDLPPALREQLRARIEAIRGGVGSGSPRPAALDSSR